VGRAWAMRSAAVERVLARLGQAKPRPSGGWSAKCPAHDGQGDTSLSIEASDDGKALVHCFAGCTFEQIVAALGLSEADLFARRNGGEEGGRPIPPNNSATAQQSAGCTLAQYAEAKQLPVAFLRGLGLSDISYLGSPAIRIPYLDESGNEATIRFRLALDKATGGDSRLHWKSGAKPCLYGRWRLAHAKEAGYVVLVEGESDAQTLWWHKIPAIGVPGAGNWREERDAPALDGISTVYVIVEPDKGGETVTKWLARSAVRDRVRLVALGEHKDASAFYLADPEHFRERWASVLAQAVPWAQHAAGEADAARDEAWQQCQELARTPRILDRFAADLARSGVAGEDRAAKLIYLVVTSRLLDRPVSAAIKGPSAGANPTSWNAFCHLFRGPPITPFQPCRSEPLPIRRKG
jgi:putative DNA primase/helicase